MTQARPCNRTGLRCRTRALLLAVAQPAPLPPLPPDGGRMRTIRLFEPPPSQLPLNWPSGRPACRAFEVSNPYPGSYPDVRECSQRFHSFAHIESVPRFCRRGGVHLGDTSCRPPVHLGDTSCRPPTPAPNVLYPLYADGRALQSVAVVHQSNGCISIAGLRRRGAGWRSSAHLVVSSRSRRPFAGGTWRAGRARRLPGASAVPRQAGATRPVKRARASSGTAPTSLWCLLPPR